ncbi:MAG: glycoside hydrolase family 127 protein [Planctomycetes bacterium]|nr:glycoside hydrolase family 127 protein [Planctomycetota bacterium]
MDQRGARQPGVRWLLRAARKQKELRPLAEHARPQHPSVVLRSNRRSAHPPFYGPVFPLAVERPSRGPLFRSWQKVRAGDNLASILWLYNRTGEAWLLELAHVVHQRTVRWDQKIASWHGVNICQGFREPAVYYMLAKERRLLDAAEHIYDTVMALYGQVPGGMFGADENCRPGHHGPRQAAETCSMVEFMRSFEMLLTFTGDPKWADRCEDVAYNSLPAAMSPDLKALHYLTAPNMVRLDHGSKAPILENSGCMLALSAHRYRCCQHNAHIGWPYFAEHLWFATQDSGLAVVFYAPCELQAKVANGVDVIVIEQTDYPFDDTVTFTFKTPSPVCFPLYLRVPDWCDAMKLAINAPRRAGGFSPRGRSSGVAFSPSGESAWAEAHDSFWGSPAFEPIQLPLR